MPRKIIVNLATSADGFIARPNGDLDWLTGRARPKGGYGLPAFERSVDAKILGRRTFERSLELGARFREGTYYVFSQRPRPADVPETVAWVSEPIGAFARRVRRRSGKNIWLMGGGELIGAFLDAHAVDELVITTIPVLIGEGLPLLGRKPRSVALRLLDLKNFSDGSIQRRYAVKR